MIKLKSLITEDINSIPKLSYYVDIFKLSTTTKYEYAPGKFREGYIFPYDVDFKEISHYLRIGEDFPKLFDWNIRPRTYYLGFEEKTKQLYLSCLLKDKFDLEIWYDNNITKNTRKVYTRHNTYHNLNITTFVDFVSTKRGNYMSYYIEQLSNELVKYIPIQINSLKNCQTRYTDNVLNITLYATEILPEKDAWKLYDKIESNMEMITKIFEKYTNVVHLCYVSKNKNNPDFTVCIRPNGNNFEYLDSVTFE